MLGHTNVYTQSLMDMHTHAHTHPGWPLHPLEDVYPPIEGTLSHLRMYHICMLQKVFGFLNFQKFNDHRHFGNDYLEVNLLDLRLNFEQEIFRNMFSEIIGFSKVFKKVPLNISH